MSFYKRRLHGDLIVSSFLILPVSERGPTEKLGERNQETGRGKGGHNEGDPSLGTVGIGQAVMGTN